MNCAIVLAGGKGTRMNSEIPKQFLVVGGKPLISYSLDVFEKSPFIDAIIIVTSQNYTGYMKALVKENGYKKIAGIALGGKERYDSVHSGLELIQTLMSSGAARAAGVPKPAAPSMNAPKMKPMITAWIRASGEIPVNIPLMAAIAPELERVFIIRMAPKIITSTAKASRKPMTVCNATAPMLIFHTATPMMAAKTHANGSALLAGQLNATINTTVTMIGMKASIAYITYTSLRFFICNIIESSELLSG